MAAAHHAALFNLKGALPSGPPSAPIPKLGMFVLFPLLRFPSGAASISPLLLAL